MGEKTGYKKSRETVPLKAMACVVDILSWAECTVHLVDFYSNGLPNLTFLSGLFQGQPHGFHNMALNVYCEAQAYRPAFSLYLSRCMGLPQEALKI